MSVDPDNTHEFVAERRPQFGLRSLIYALVLACAALAVLTHVGPYTALALVLAAGLVTAHVVGNALGTRLRDDSTAKLQRNGVRDERPLRHPSPPPPTILRDDAPLGRGAIVPALIGALAGAAAIALLTRTAWSRIGPSGMCILELSGATIGLYFGFLFSRLLVTLRGAMRQASGQRD